ncbi:MAG: sigma-70 family RNA polymerase sigma factor [Lapillicoccus sp.]
MSPTDPPDLPRPARPDSSGRSEVDWVAALGGQGPRREVALAELHGILVRIAHAEVRRRGNRLRLAGPELEDLADQAADDALLAITTKLHTFRGESRFTTWAYAFVIREVSNKLGRHFWRRPTAPMEAADWERLPDRFGMGPAENAQHRDLVQALRRVVDEELTEHQRRVFTAIVVDGIPLDALAVRLDSNRNAIYKTMFDARRKIRAALVAKGHLDVARDGSSSVQAPIQAVRRT